LGIDPNLEHFDPNLWIDEFAFLSHPGQETHKAMPFYGYRSNVDALPEVAGLDAREEAARW